MLRLCNQFHPTFVSETSISTYLSPHGRVIITYYSLLKDMRLHVSLYSFIVTLHCISWKTEQLIPPNKHWYLWCFASFHIKHRTS